MFKNIWILFLLLTLMSCINEKNDNKPSIIDNWWSISIIWNNTWNNIESTVDDSSVKDINTIDL